MLEFLKERYDFEISRKDSLNNLLNTSITVLVVVGSALVFLISNWQLPFCAFIWLSMILGVASAYALVRSVIKLLFVLNGYDYQILPDAKALLQHKKELEEYAKQYAGKVPPAEELFENYLISRLSEAASKNQESNNKKSECITIANKWLVRAACFCAISAIPFFLDRMTHKEVNVQKVELVSPIKLTTMADNDPPPPPPPPPGPTNQIITASEPPVAPPPPPPSGPTNQFINEGTEE